MFFYIRNYILIVLVVFLFAFKSHHVDSRRIGSSTHLSKETDNKLFFLGEIKGVSYIKLTLVKVEEPTSYSNSTVLRYSGSYYESVTGKTYAVVGSFDSEKRDWTLKSFDDNNNIFGVFTGKQNWDGDIRGYWKCKNKKSSFYLKRQERKAY